MLVRIICAGVLFVAALLLPLQGIFRLFGFLLPYLIIGCDVILSALKNILHGEIFDEEFLMTLATAGALILGEYPEAVAVMLFFQIGEFFEDAAVEKSRDHIRALTQLRPDTASVLRDGRQVTVSPSEVAIGETILICPGERIPLDGLIIRGDTTVDTSPLTGESMPSELHCGDAIVSGCVNLTGTVEVQTTGSLEQSTAARILALVESASERKSRAESFITKFAKIYTPCVVCGAVLLAVIPSVFAGMWTEWIRRALVFLVVSCPCALVVSVPLSFFGGIGGASKKGILIKGSEYIEALSKLKTVAFDKTGTLTQGRFSVSKLIPNDCSEADLLEIAAYAESESSHPIARSVISAYNREINSKRIGSLTEHAGHGVEAEIDGALILAGNLRLLQQHGVSVPEIHESETAVYVAKNGHYLGCITLEDVPKSGSVRAVSDLKALGIRKTVMLTGDRQAIAHRVAHTLGIDEVHAELLPGDKVSVIESLLSDEGTTAFAGDGINDAPVLMRADVGIAMGALGTDAAIEAADVVLMNDDPTAICTAVRISGKTMRIVRENIVLALSVKLVILLLSAFGLLGQYGMWIAVFADVGVLILAVLNALRTFFVMFISQ